MLKETNKRSVVKTISWRVCATVTTMSIVYLFTRELSLSLGVGVVEVLSKMLLYYVHERAWAKASWGFVQHPLSELPVKKELTTEDMSIIKDKLKDLGYID
ncbi:DUF2061 domain-containing protein [Candidatus Omnitrophota bacterium]